MEFTGRVKKLLPIRSGVSQRTNNEWKALPFVFEYFENPTDRYADSVLLETFDTNVIDNLKEGMEVRCGFAHRTREYEGKTYNELRLYKIESVKGAKQAAQATSAPAAEQSPTPQPNGAQAPQNDPNDDLPF
jgi:hypothetical protein